MNTIDSYRKSAERCRELAARARSEEERKLLLKLADSWDWLARDTDPESDGQQNANARKADSEG
ncbi:MAG TPA: hypothetical protein VNL39_07335 [Xanthobacteraceae bacterium]|nr:hypothetical protein [Xanthobacteraceae bacterium]